jgi:hypothetical protein
VQFVSPISTFIGRRGTSIGGTCRKRTWKIEQYCMRVTQPAWLSFVAVPTSPAAGTVGLGVSSALGRLLDPTKPARRSGNVGLLRYGTLQVRRESFTRFVGGIFQTLARASAQVEKILSHEIPSLWSS